MSTRAPEQPPSDPRTGPPQSPSLAISNQIVRLLSHYAGRGPTKARTTLASDAVMVVLHDALTRAEQTLVAVGHPESVRTIRRPLYDLMREDARIAVEEVLHRRVTAVLADIDPDANVAALVFTLAPQPDTDVPERSTSPKHFRMRRAGPGRPQGLRPTAP
ncbi:MAG: DUF2294 family protein [Solirubrobacterales bacterium]|nr:DUF2294 family protein [Solirubrobacterales bacterium]